MIALLRYLAAAPLALFASPFIVAGLAILAISGAINGGKIPFWEKDET